MENNVLLCDYAPDDEYNANRFRLFFNPKHFVYISNSFF